MLQFIVISKATFIVIDVIFTNFFIHLQGVPEFMAATVHATFQYDSSIVLTSSVSDIETHTHDKYVVYSGGS